MAFQAPPIPPLQSPQQAYLARFGGLADRVAGNSPPPAVAAARFAAASPGSNAPGAQQALQNLKSAIPPLPVIPQTITQRENLAPFPRAVADVVVQRQNQPNPGPLAPSLDALRLQSLQNRSPTKPTPLDNLLSGFR